MLRLYYEGCEITRFVGLKSCVATDTAGERCDSLRVEFESPETWLAWGTAADERIRVTMDGYDTGELYVHSMEPEGNAYRILATALPCRARRKQYRSYRGKTLEEIIQHAAQGCGMDAALYGVNGAADIPYIQQENEGGAGFLRRLLTAEGAVLKCVNGKMTAIDVRYAQNRAAHQTMRLSDGQEGVCHRKNGRRLRALTVKTPWAEATATDEAAGTAHEQETENRLPALTDVQAGRWARGLLLLRNLRCESLEIESEYNPGLTAMTRIDVTGGTETSGEWLIETAEHDFINRTSSVLMRRCVGTVR